MALARMGQSSAGVTPEYEYIIIIIIIMAGIFPTEAIVKKL